MNRNEENELKRNASGYLDPTAYEAIKNILKEESDEERFRRLLKNIFKICELSGFHLEERIIVKDVRTGKVWK